MDNRRRLFMMLFMVMTMVITMAFTMAFTMIPPFFLGLFGLFLLLALFWSLFLLFIGGRSGLRR